MQLSISKIKTFKACRRMYELKYFEKLVPIKKPEALETGSNFHEFIEHLNKHGDFIDCEEDYSQSQAMAVAYEKYVYPQLKVVEAEKWYEKALISGDVLVGRVDGIAEDGNIVEYKTTGIDLEQYEYNLQWDEQILAYMYLTDKRKIYYVIVKKPTIRQKKDETVEEFYDRMVRWYDEDTESKIKLLKIEKTDDDVAEFEDELMAIAHEMLHAGHYYRNTCHCNMWGRRCEYSSVCMHYDPNQEYLEFTKGE